MNKHILRPRLTRRQMLKLGLVAGGAALLPMPYITYRAYKGNLPPRAFAKDIESPPTTPFVDELPIPPAPIEVAAFPSLECDGSMIDPTDYTAPDTKFYKIRTEETFVSFHSELAVTQVWRYRDVNAPADSPFAVGPTFKVRMSTATTPGVQGGVVVRHINNLPSGHTGFGMPFTTVHLHGGHHPARSDGFPDDISDYPGLITPIVIPPDGGERDYCYPLLDVGFLDGPLAPEERPSTLWYHDHFLDFTGPNVYRGLAGFFLVFDELDNDDETVATPIVAGPYAGRTSLQLPSGPFDIPLVLQDKLFNPDGSLFFDSFDHNGFLGDKFVVNGKIQPFFEVKRRKYRFRFLNGSNARIWQLFLTNEDGQTFPFDLIAASGGLLSSPIRNVKSFIIAMAQRKEAVIDFSPFPLGAKVYLENRLRQDDGRGPKGDFDDPKILSRGPRILEFRVVEDVVSDPSEVPDELRPFDPIPQDEVDVATVKTFEFARKHGAWVINDKFVDLENPLDSPSPRGVPEIWRLINKSGGWWHPIHIHLEFFRILSRNGKLPPLIERDGRAQEDTVILGPNDEVDVFLKFRDYPGPFVFHCHNLEHEDLAMMARFDVA